MIRSILAGTALAALLAACSPAERTETAQDAGATVNAAQDATSGVVGQTSAATLGANTTAAFVPSLAMSDMYELESAKIASARSSDAGVKALAAMITTDHTASTAKTEDHRARRGAGRHAADRPG